MYPVSTLRAGQYRCLNANTSKLSSRRTVLCDTGVSFMSSLFVKVQEALSVDAVAEKMTLGVRRGSYTSSCDFLYCAQ